MVVISPPFNISPTIWRICRLSLCGRRTLSRLRKACLYSRSELPSAHQRASTWMELAISISFKLTSSFWSSFCTIACFCQCDKSRIHDDGLIGMVVFPSSAFWFDKLMIWALHLRISSHFRGNTLVIASITRKCAGWCHLSGWASRCFPTTEHSWFMLTVLTPGPYRCWIESETPATYPRYIALLATSPWLSVPALTRWYAFQSGTMSFPR